MYRILRKSAFCENKGADQLCSNCTADQRPLFSPHGWYNSSSTYIQSFKLLVIFCDRTGQFVSYRVGTPDGRFPRVVTLVVQLIVEILHFVYKLIGIVCPVITGRLWTAFRQIGINAAKSVLWHYFKYESCHGKTGCFACAKIKLLISFAVTEQLTSAFVFTLQIEQSISCLFRNV